MQTVSQEWIDNQSSIIRKPGFIAINIPDVKISCGSISYRVEQSANLYTYTSDPMGCDYIDTCEINIFFNKTVLGSNTVSIKGYSENGAVLVSRSITSSSLDTNGMYSFESTGYSKLVITCKTNAVTDIKLYAYGIPRKDISSYTHSRSYDPMGFELPTNDISLDVYNYGDKYTDFYKGYSNEGYQIIVYYGYKLDSGDEVILGGTFHLTDVQLSDNMLTLVGENLLSFIDEKGTIDLFDLKADENDCIYIWVSDSNGTTSVDFTSREEFNITAEDLLTYLRDTAQISISANSTYTSVFTSNGGINENYIDIMQSLINLLLTRCFIDRNDIIHYDVCQSTNVISGNDILMMNCTDTPLYSSTKKVKKFEVTVQVAGATQELYDEGDVNSGYHTGSWSLDLRNNKLLSLKLPCSGIRYVNLYPSRIQVYYRTSSSMSGTYVSIKYAPFTDGIETVIVDETGVICDISSPLGRPSDYDKIVNYFSNRDLYTFYVRGNPARDVGDYVNVSLTNDDDTSTYKKGLVLSSILTYDGSFKEEVTVRIIENDFE